MTIKWNVQGMADAYRDRPPTEWVIDGFFTTASLNIVYGNPASFKSMIMADAAGAVVAGQSWLPGALGNSVGVEVQKGAVLWIDMDNGLRRTHERIEAIGRSRNLPEDAPFHYVSMPNPPFQLHPGYRYSSRDEDDNEIHYSVIDVMMYVVELAEQLKAKMIFIDNLGLITGDVDENTAQMAAIMGYLRMIAEHTNAAVIVIHHERKGGANGAAAGAALRGHSSISAAVDLALQITRDGEKPEITIKSTKTRGVDVPTVKAVFNHEHRQGTKDLLKAWFSGVSGSRGENVIWDAVRDVLSFGAMSKTKLIHNVNAMLPETGQRKITAWVTDMIGNGELLVERGQGNVQMISLPK
jgi:hypothetical protein